MATAAWHSLEAEQVLKELNSDSHRGLTAEEVRSRLEQYGYNELQREKKVLVHNLKESPCSLLLII